MNNEIYKKLLEAEYYQNELEENQRSVLALIKLLEHEGTNHSQYNQLDYLQNRNKEINNQLICLYKIINELRHKIENG
jgi:hypothetical protein